MIEEGRYSKWIPHTHNVQISPKIRQALAYINSNYTQNIKLGKVASRVGINPHYLSKRFRQDLKIGFRDYLQGNRIRIASRLLVCSLKSVKEISYEVGFSRPEIFSKTFKRLMGCSPRTYRLHNFPMDENTCPGSLDQLQPVFTDEMSSALSLTESP